MPSPRAKGLVCLPWVPSQEGEGLVCPLQEDSGVPSPPNVILIVIVIIYFVVLATFEYPAEMSVSIKPMADSMESAENYKS